MVRKNDEGMVYLVINHESRLRSIFWTEYQLLEYLAQCYAPVYFTTTRNNGMLSIEEIDVISRTTHDLGRRIYYQPKGVMEYKIDREML